MPLSDHASITITVDSAGPARAGFGVPMILSAYAAWAERVRTYTSLADVAADFSTSNPEYRAAQAMFAQRPKPKKIKIGRSALKPTKRYTLSVAAVRNSYTYKIKVTGKGFATGGTVVSFASDASATDGEIVVGLVAALNAVATNNYIAAGTVSPFTVTGDAAGDWFSLEVLNDGEKDSPDDLTMTEDHADPGVATDLAAIALEDPDWYCLHTMYNSEAYVKAAAAWVESNKRIYVFDSQDTIALTVAADGTQGLLDDLKTLAYARTMGAYHHNGAEMMAAAWMGRVLPRDPGGVTWAYKRLTGITKSTFTATHRTNLDARNANYYKDEAGIAFTWKGKAFDGDYFDVIRDLDFWEDDLGKSILTAFLNSEKILFTQGGLNTIEGLMRGSTEKMIRKTILSPDVDPEYTVPEISEVSAADKANRLLTGLAIGATLAGAIQSVEININVSV